MERKQVDLSIWHAYKYYDICCIQSQSIPTSLQELCHRIQPMSSFLALTPIKDKKIDIKAKVLGHSVRYFYLLHFRCYAANTIGTWLVGLTDQ